MAEKLVVPSIIGNKRTVGVGGNTFWVSSNNMEEVYISEISNFLKIVTQ